MNPAYLIFGLAMCCFAVSVLLFSAAIKIQFDEWRRKGRK